MIFQAWGLKIRKQTRQRVNLLTCCYTQFNLLNEIWATYNKRGHRKNGNDFQDKRKNQQVRSKREQTQACTNNLGACVEGMQQETVPLQLRISGAFLKFKSFGWTRGNKRTNVKIIYVIIMQIFLLKFQTLIIWTGPNITSRGNAKFYLLNKPNKFLDL